MIYKLTLTSFGLIFLLGLFLTLRPCSNGSKITILNAYGEDVVLNFYDAGWDNIILTLNVPAHSVPVYKRAYIAGTQTYLIEVQNAHNTKVMMRGEFGYISKPDVSSAFFMIDKNEIKFASWSYDNIYRTFFEMGADILSCTDSYILGEVKNIY